jgi:hypothetical protein
MKRFPAFDGPQRCAAVVGQAFGPAAGLPPGAEFYVSAGSAGDLVAGPPAWIAKML